MRYVACATRYMPQRGMFMYRFAIIQIKSPNSLNSGFYNSVLEENISQAKPIPHIGDIYRRFAKQIYLAAKLLSFA